MRILLCLLAGLLALPVTAPAQALEYHFLTVKGKALPLQRVALNGKTVLSGTLISVSLPVYVDKYLKSGQNELEVEYTSDKAEGLTIAVEARTSGSKKREVVRFSSAAGETGGKMVTKTISFTAHVRPLVPVALTDADRQAIAAVLQTQHTVLTHRDAVGLRRLYEKTMQEGMQIYPEGVEFFKSVLDDSLKMLASPKFRMKPFQPTGLQFSVDGERVRVSRTDGTPVMESDLVEIDEDVTFTRNGKEVHETQKIQSQIRSMSVAVRKYDGRWYLAMPFGI